MTRVSRKWWAFGLLVLVVYAGIPAVGLLRDPPAGVVPAAGPLQGPTGTGAGVPARVGEPVDFAFISLVNPTSSPILLEGVTLVSLPKSLRMLGTFVEVGRTGRGGGAFYGLPPPTGILGGVWRPLDGAVLPPRSSTPPSDLGLLGLGLEAVRRGLSNAVGVKVRYEWRGSQYLATFSDTMELCVDMDGCP